MGMSECYHGRPAFYCPECHRKRRTAKIDKDFRNFMPDPSVIYMNPEGDWLLEALNTNIYKAALKNFNKEKNNGNPSKPAN